MPNIIIKKEDVDLKPGSTAKEVIIYSDKAQVKRVKRIDLAEGENTVVFPNLGRGIDEQSIKALLRSDKAKIVSAGMITNYLYFFKADENEKIYNRILDSLKKIIRLLDEKSVCALENNLITDLRDYVCELLNDIILDQENSIPRLKAALEFLGEKLDQNTQSVIALNEEFDDLIEEYAILSEKLRKIRELDKRTQNNIEVAVIASSACSEEVEVSYILPGAAWRSAYDAKLTTDTQKTDLFYYGEICQNTGEDWENVKVILSTSVAESLVQIPLIYPVYASGFHEKRNRVLAVDKETVRGLKDMEEDDGTLGGEPEPEQTGEDNHIKGGKPEKRIEAEKKGVSHTFTVEKPYSIPSDNKWHRILIMHTGFESKLTYETIPEYMEYIYLKTAQKNTSGMPFLPGRIAIYRNESYMGQSNLAYIADGEEFFLSFGIDEDLKIKRIRHLDIARPAKGLSNKNAKEWEFHFVLYNYKKEKQKVLLKEAVYISELKEAQIKILDDTSKGYEQTKEGIVQWEPELPPDPFKHTKLVLHYTLTVPKTFSLDGV